MKRILFVATIALLTLSASAVNRTRAPKSKIAQELKTRFANERHSKFANLDAKSIENALKIRNAEQKANKIAQVKASNRASDETILSQLVPAYSEYGYFYDSEIIGGYIQRNMYDGASYLIDGEKAYLAPFENLGYVEGVLDPTADNPFAEIGAVVYKFTSDVIAYVAADEINPMVELSLEPGVFDNINYVITRSGETTFYAYYIAETDELYIPSFLALFDANSADTEVFDDYYVAIHLDLFPQQFLNQYISKGTFTGTSAYDGTVISGDCEIYFGYDSYYVKGANGAKEPAWIEFAYDESDPTIATVADSQYTGGPYRFSNANSGAEIIGYFVTVGLQSNNGAITGFTDDYTSTYKVSDNADGTTTIANTNNTLYGDYVLAAANGGMYEALDMTITITYEPAYPDAGGDDTAIKSVKSEKANANGTYNLSGQRVSDNVKGLIIKDGKKYIAK